MKSVLSALILLLIYRKQCAMVLPLVDSYKWTVCNSNGSIKITEITNPSGIYSDLRNAKVLEEDILFRFNDIKYRWVGNETWIYSVDFSVDENVKQTNSQEIIFHGLDGIATIYLNDQIIGQATNTFVRYRYDVTDVLKDNNTLKIEFQSPIKSGIALFQNSSHLVPPTCVPVSYKGECHVNFLRRMQASFAWDWGPAFPSVGIWKNIELVGRQNDVIIRDIVVETLPVDDVWRIITNVYSEIPLRNEQFFNGYIYTTFSPTDDPQDGITVSKKVKVERHSEKREIRTRLILEVPKKSVKLWWPNGYGNQYLYKLTSTFVSSDHNKTTKTIKIGFRTVKLIQDFIDENVKEKGRSFYFVINDVPIFAKGSNYIPANVLPENSNNVEVTRELLQSAKITNMNMLRVWGGGIYESDDFYQLCDEYGIMIWQDMMFACSMYPVDGEFLSSVTKEISQQIRRLQYHPSIVIWAGNNENEAALGGNWYNTAANYSLYLKEYIELYVHTVREAVFKVDGTREFLVSSPTNGIESFMEGYVSKNPYNPLYGDVHYYNYLHNSWITDHYPFTRFSSEYGFQSLPSMSTWQTVASKDDLAFLSTEFMIHRQHLPLGDIYLIYLMLFHFPAPLISDLENLIYISQINQAWSVKSQTEWYRKWRSTILPDGKGQTMGALYWQLNDIWQAPSWASIEYGGKWKMLQYYARKFFAPILVTGDISGNDSVTINLISDLLYDLPDVILISEIFKWDSLTPVDTITELVTLKKASAKVHKETNVTELIDSRPNCKTDIPGQLCFLKLTLAHKLNGSIISENHVFPVSFKTAVGIQKVNINAKVSTAATNQCEITLRTNAISLFVWLDTGNEKVLFNDNGFIMTKAEKKIMAFPKNISCTVLESILQISVLDAKRLSTLTNPMTDLFLYTRVINPFQ